MVCEAKSFGAISIVNGLATGIGASLGIKLNVRTKSFICSSEDLIRTMYRGRPINIDHNLVCKIINKFRKIFKINNYIGVIVDSEIPPERGLKSSSAVANSVILSLCKLFDIKMGINNILRLNAEASLESGVSITGAFDDSAATLLGGIIIADNNKWKILQVMDVLKEYKVIIGYSDRKARTSQFRNIDYSPIKKIIEQCIDLCFRNRWVEAMIINGIFYSYVYGYDVNPIFEAIREGALAASISGTGPSYVAIGDDLSSVIDIWVNKFGLNILVTEVRKINERFIH